MKNPMRTFSTEAGAHAEEDKSISEVSHEEKKYEKRRKRRPSSHKSKY